MLVIGGWELRSANYFLNCLKKTLDNVSALVEPKLATTDLRNQAGPSGGLREVLSLTLLLGTLRSKWLDPTF